MASVDIPNKFVNWSAVVDVMQGVTNGIISQAALLKMDGSLIAISNPNHIPFQFGLLANIWKQYDELESSKSHVGATSLSSLLVNCEV